MNFLAHTLFAHQDAQLIVGQFCGDFVRGNNFGHLPPRVRHGIKLHREIDIFTDQHPVNLEARRLFKSPYRRFAGILTDVVYDHYLARNWSQYSSMSLSRHVSTVNDALDRYTDILPPNLKRFAGHLQTNSVMEGYLEFDAVDEALERISRRSHRFELLSEAGPLVYALDAELSDCFARFFPDLISHMAAMEQI